MTTATAFATLEVAADTARAVPEVAALEALCAGHFPGEPMVPGAYLLGLMAALAERLGGGPVREVTRCLLIAPVRPDQRVVLTARRTGNDVDVTVDADGRTAARARIVIGDGA